MRQPLQRILTATAIAVAMCLPAPPVGATLLQSCCACVADQRAQTNGVPAPGAQVFFCAEADTGDVPALEARCDAVSSQTGSLYCEANVPGPSCRDQLADGGLFCPTAGAPVASPLHLVALGGALGALGIAAARRRRQPTKEDRP